MADLWDPERAVYRAKLILLLLEVGGECFVDTLFTLYSQDEPIEEKSLKIAQIKSNDFNPDQKRFLENVHKGQAKLRHMDITLSYKLIQLTCRLEPLQSAVWGDQCPEDKRNCLEYLLYKYKSWRNTLTHEFRSIKINTNEDFIKMKETITEHLFSIVDKVCEREDLTRAQKEEWKNKIEAYSNMFCEQIVTKPSTLPNPASAISTTTIVAEQQALTDKNVGKAFISTVRTHITTLPQHAYKNEALNIFKNALLEKISSTTLEIEALDWRTKSYERSNRLYWIRRIVTTATQQNIQETAKVWEEYDEYLN